MEEFELDNLWKGEEDSAHQYYEQIKPEILERSRKKSRGVIARVRRNTKWELVASALTVPMVFVFIPSTSATYWLLLVLLGIAVPLTFYYYLKFNRDISSINTKSVKEALEKEISVLSKFVKRLNFYTIVVLPIAYFGGIVAQMIDDDEFNSGEDLTMKIVIHLIVSIPVLSAFAWFFVKKYIFWLYGKPLKELREIYEHLINGKDQEG